MIFVFVWALSAILSLVYVVLMLTKGFDSYYHYPHGWSSAVEFWQDFPFGMGYLSAIFVAMFIVFPVINTAIVVAITCWFVYRMKKDNLTLSDLFPEEENK